MRLLALLLQLGHAWGASPAGGVLDGPSGSEHGVTWVVQLSDLHLSAHSYPERCARVPPVARR